MSGKAALARPLPASPAAYRKGLGPTTATRGSRAVQRAGNGGSHGPPVSPAFRAAWERVCERVARGDAMIHAAHQEAPALGISGSVMVERVRTRAELWEAVQRAREVWIAKLLDEQRTLGLLPEMAPADRVRAQRIQWELERLEPTRFGARQQLDVGGQGGAPIPLAVTITAVDARRLARDDSEDP